MSRYRKIDPRFWKDEKVMNLTPEGKLIALYLFTGQLNRIGLFNFSPGEAAEDLSLSVETFREGFGNVCKTLNFGWDETFRVLYLPTWWRYNTPENPNVLKSCLADLHEIPKTGLIAEFSNNLSHLPETFHQTFLEGLGKPSPKRMAHQEQEQEQEQKKDKPSKARAASKDSGSDPRVKQFIDWWVTEYRTRFDEPYHLNGNAGKVGARIKDTLKTYDLSKLQLLALQSIRKTGGFSERVAIPSKSS